MTHLRVHFNNNKVAQRFRLQIGNAFIEDEQWTWVVQHRITTSILVIGIHNESRCLSSSICKLIYVFLFTVI